MYFVKLVGPFTLTSLSIFFSDILAPTALVLGRAAGYITSEDVINSFLRDRRQDLPTLYSKQQEAQDYTQRTFFFGKYTPLKDLNSTVLKACPWGIPRVPCGKGVDLVLQNFQHVILITLLSLQFY